jgi:formylglycine-generating enzyme required for sulfatase activity
MKKDLSWLMAIVLFGLLLGACGTQEIAPTFTPDPTNTKSPMATNTPVPTNTPEATATNTPEPTDLPEPTETAVPPTATPEPTAVEPEGPALGSTRVSEADQMVEVYIPAGEFIMGTNDNEAITTTVGGRAYPEIPAHTVYLDSYWIDKYEVSNGQYALCVEAGACQPPFIPTSYSRKEYYGNPEYSNYPVIWVKWEMARTYCEWADRRLPTEAEWEKAARGTDGRKYPWGNEPSFRDPAFGERLNLCDVNCPKDFANPLYNDGYADTSPVGNYPAGASPYGVMDMAGNVWEWNGSFIAPYPYDASDGREAAEGNEERSWRGAAFANGYWWVRSSVRYRSVINYWYYNLGFRCASSN